MEETPFSFHLHDPYVKAQSSKQLSILVSIDENLICLIGKKKISIINIQNMLFDIRSTHVYMSHMFNINSNKILQFQIVISSLNLKIKY
jgi:hypothetical protein